MRKIVRIAFIFMALSMDLNAQPTRIDPPNWWIGIPNDTLQLLIEGKSVADWKMTVAFPGIRLIAFKPMPNRDFGIAHLVIDADARPGLIPLDFTNGKKKVRLQYQLSARSASPKGLSKSDFIYLVMPDRFANGDAKNDDIKGMNEGLNRNDPYGRHGGDLKGLTDRIEHMKELGASALWLTPVFENNQPKESYHGYAITDHYKIDPRLGDSADFRALVNDLHNNGMKYVLDVVFNHIGDRHRFYSAMIDSNWFHLHPEYFRSNFRAGVLMDPNASEYDKRKFSTGWFDTHMPDLNQKNPDLARYLIQNSIWWVEQFGIDAIRIDTYAYPDQQFMAEWNKAMKKAFPTLFIFGEIWDHAAGIQAWFTSGNALNREFDSGLEQVTDFEFYHRVNRALHEPFGWTEGVSRLYYHFTQDFLYKKSDELVTFLDNHDLDRYWGTLDGNFEKWKSGMVMLMTARGIPCIFYGTELLMAERGSHGKIRQDFPGGWPGDSVNAFLPQGRNAQQNEAFDFIRNLSFLRRNSAAISKGYFTQFVPEDGVYVFFRHYENEKLMIVFNGNENAKTIGMEKFDEFIKPGNALTELVSGLKFSSTEKLNLKPWQSLILQVR